MPTVKHKGVEIQCATAAEAIEVYRGLTGEGSKASKPSKVDSAQRPTREHARAPRPKAKPRKLRPARTKVRDTSSALGRGIAVLDLLMKHPGGLKTDELVSLLGLSEGRALSGFITKVGPILEYAGVDPEKAFDRERLRRGSSWKAGPEASKALSILEQAAEADLAENGGGSS